MAHTGAAFISNTRLAASLQARCRCAFAEICGSCRPRRPQRSRGETTDPLPTNSSGCRPILDRLRVREGLCSVEVDQVLPDHLDLHCVRKYALELAQSVLWDEREDVLTRLR
jgi:hypothetical protein